VLTRFWEIIVNEVIGQIALMFFTEGRELEKLFWKERQQYEVSCM